ncbi:hypothetical protein MNBD_GAMMA25-702 [hydrothermal vent metagenome]|uniref:HTH tetR-type domain-containing protein n=1 Tax=hydrothermal vent metagenome TaxID=652676 RepID=A0A3B1BA38_9ZZZZ
MGRSPTKNRATLLQTANELIWKHSYGSVTVDDICTASGVNKGSFYYYFSSKAELAVAVMEESYQSFESELRKVFSADVTSINRFERLAEFVYKKQKEAYDKYGRVCGCPFASLGSEMAGNEDIIQKKADEIFVRQGAIFIETLQQMINAGQLPEETNKANKAAQIITFIMGQLMMARIQNNLSNLKKDIRQGLFQTLGINVTVQN